MLRIGCGIDPTKSHLTTQYQDTISEVKYSKESPFLSSNIVRLCMFTFPMDEFPQTPQIPSPQSSNPHLDNKYHALRQRVLQPTFSWIGATLSGEIFQQYWLRSQCFQIQPITWYDLLVILYQFGVYSINSSKMIRNFPAILKLNRCIYNQQSVLPVHRCYTWPCLRIYYWIHALPQHYSKRLRAPVVCGNSSMMKEGRSSSKNKSPTRLRTNSF